MLLSSYVVVLLTILLLRGRPTAPLTREPGGDNNTRRSRSDPPYSSIHLLVVLPLATQPFQPIAKENESQTVGQQRLIELPPWDRGLEILPAAYVARDQINEDPSLLSGAELEVVAVNSSFCHSRVGSEISTLVSFVKTITKLSQKSLCFLGLTGLFCESSTILLSSVATSAHLNLLQLSGSASPVFQLQGGDVRDKFKSLYQMIASTSTYCDATRALMRLLGWERIAIVSDCLATYYKSTADMCYRNFNGHVNINITFFGDVTTQENSASNIVSNLRFSSSRIVFLSVRSEIALKILCSAIQEGIGWPHYVWIIYDHTPSDLLAHSTKTACSSEMIEAALDGALLLRYNLKTGKPSGRLGGMIMNYTTAYRDSLRQMEEVKGLATSSLKENDYANVLYDSVLAFALALNSSSSLQCNNTSSRQKLINNAQNGLYNLSFMGASGVVAFKNRQVATTVTIYHYANKTEVFVASYISNNLSFVNQSYLYSREFPNDEVPRHYILYPVPLTTTFSVVTTLCFIGIAAMLVLFLHFRSEPEIKATSPFLSLNISLGSFLLLASPTANLILYSIVTSSATSRALCISILWSGFLGLNLIWGTLLIRMIRIYYIFEVNHFGRMRRKAWSDWTLFGMVLAILCVVSTILLIVCIVDPPYIMETETYISSTSPPHYSVFRTCYNEHVQIWLGLLWGEVGILFLAVGLLAVKTRKIKRCHFKDTKKVSAYIFLMTVTLCLILPLWWVLNITNNRIGMNIVHYSAYVHVTTSCQLLLFVPKVFPPLLRHIRGRLPPQFQWAWKVSKKR